MFCNIYLKNSDENHAKSAYDIMGYLEEDGIVAERRKSARYTVSSFQRLINDSNYYLLAFDDEKGEMRTYRVDRMKDDEPYGEPREGEEVFKTLI